MNEEPLPPSPPPVATPPAVQPAAPATSDERTLGIVMHIFGLIGLPIIGPLVVWLMKKDQSPYINAQGRELLNFQITYFIYAVASMLLMFVLIGFLLIFVVGIASLVFTVIGIVKASDGEVYRFPAIFRFF